MGNWRNWNIIMPNFTLTSIDDPTKYLHCRYHAGTRMYELEGVWRCPQCGSSANEEELRMWKALLEGKDPSVELTEKEKGVLKPRIKKNKGPMAITAKGKKKLTDSLGNELPEEFRSEVMGGKKVVYYHEYTNGK